MDNNYVIERIMKNLAFELEPGPIKETSSDGDPLSVKIKIRNRQAKVTEPGLILKKVRLVNSNETLMSFDMLMEKDYRQVTARKSRKNTGNFFDKLKPGLCIKQMDDNDYVYLPSSDHNYNNPEIKDEFRKQQLKLSDKEIDTSARTGNSKKEKTFLGTKCKAGGCLDPSFHEDRYSYGPNLKDSVGQDLKGPLKVKPVDLDIDTKSIKTRNYYKSKDVPLLIKPIDDDISVSKKESLQISLITYPTHDENNKEIRYRSNEDRPSITESINVIFNPPKGFKRNSNNYLQQPSSKIKSDSENDVIQKNKKYLRENELQYQQQVDIMTVSNIKCGSNINLDYIETIRSSRTSYSTSDESNLHRIEAIDKEQNDKNKSRSRLSKELKTYKHSDAELDNINLQSIKDIDTSATNGKTKKEKTFLGSTCKPGGCLDPSFDEDTYIYHPSTQVVSKQSSKIAKAKQENSNVNRRYDDHNVKLYKLNQIDSIKNSSPTYTSENALNTEEAEITEFKNNRNENKAQYFNNNSAYSFIKPCQQFEQDFNNYKQQSTCSLLNTINDKVEHAESSISSLSTFLSPQPNPNCRINNDIQPPSGTLLLEQDSVSENIVNKESSKSFSILGTPHLNSSSNLNSGKIDYVNATDTRMSTTESVIKKETAKSKTYVGSLNTPSEKYSTSSTIDNTLEGSYNLVNQIAQNITTNIDDVESKLTKSFDEYSNNTTDLKTNNDESPSPSNIYKTESPKSLLEISDSECQAEGNWRSDDKVSLKNEQTIPNKCEPPVNESENSLFSPSKEIESNSNFLQNSANYNSEFAVKIKPTKTSISPLNLSASSELSLSISTIQSTYTKSASGSPQNIHTMEIIEHKEISKTTSVTEGSLQSLGANLITNENVSLIKDIQQNNTEYFLIADTTDLIYEIDSAKIYEDNTDQFEANQYDSHVFTKTEEQVEDSNQLSSQLMMDQDALNTKNIEYNGKKIPDSNEAVVENEALKLSNNTISDSLAKSSDYNTFYDIAVNQTTDNNNSDSLVTENKELQYQNQNANEIRISKENKITSFIWEAEINEKRESKRDKTSIIDQKDKIGKRDLPKDGIVNIEIDPVEYDNIHIDDKRYPSGENFFALDPDINDSHHIPSTAKQKQVLANLYKNELKNIKNLERSESSLGSFEDSSSVKLNDEVILDLTFQSYMNEKNQRIIRTIKNGNEGEGYPNDSTFVLKSQIKLSHNKSNQKINIPLGSDVGMIINIKNISEDECSKPTNESIPALNQTVTKKALNKADYGKKLVHIKTNVNSTLTHIYEQDLMPLKTMIKNLKYEIEDLGKQQMLLKKQALCVKQPNLQRNKSCNKKLDSKNVNFCMCRRT